MPKKHKVGCLGFGNQPGVHGGMPPPITVSHALSPSAPAMSGVPVERALLAAAEGGSVAAVTAKPHHSTQMDDCTLPHPPPP